MTEFLYQYTSFISTNGPPTTIIIVKNRKHHTHTYTHTHKITHPNPIRGQIASHFQRHPATLPLGGWVAPPPGSAGSPAPINRIRTGYRRLGDLVKSMPDLLDMTPNDRWGCAGQGCWNWVAPPPICVEHLVK